MAHFARWKATQANRSMVTYDNARAPCERKKENWRREDLPEDQHSSLGQELQKGEGAQGVQDRNKETAEDKITEKDSPFSKSEPHKGSKGLKVLLLLGQEACQSWESETAGMFSNPLPCFLGTDWKLPIPLEPVYPPLISSSISATKAGGRSWDLSPRIAKTFRIHDVPVSCLPQQGPFRQYMDKTVEKRLASWKERRSRFGDVNVHKCYQFGQIFSPFQALATTAAAAYPPIDWPTFPKHEHVHSKVLSTVKSGTLKRRQQKPNKAMKHSYKVTEPTPMPYALC
ncbi:PREDICTED: uncharacterized protein LOC102835109 [Chrysochloris asiatica]|uniref:Uncharacterized protein LOC102835109 n=1 Tax=Chrysochloris asiatica TaxID=185453 RepID=A0A9B0T1E3_CHRAS|nr:PREDICTED: uncharacterized protein LOC102835109 [Chrysochloris asiatica]